MHRTTGGELRIGAVNLHLLVRSGVGVLEAAGQSDGKGIAAHQIAGVQHSGHSGSLIAVIGL